MTRNVECAGVGGHWPNWITRGVQSDGIIIGPINALGLHSDVTRVPVLAIEHWAGALCTPQLQLWPDVWRIGYQIRTAENSSPQPSFDIKPL